eukprot:863435-Rhodomonas_salina.2
MPCPRSCRLGGNCLAGTGHCYKDVTTHTDASYRGTARVGFAFHPFAEGLPVVVRPHDPRHDPQSLLLIVPASPPSYHRQYRSDITL